MPIQFRDQNSVRARINALVAGDTADFDGTAGVTAPITGALSAQGAPDASAITGLFTAAPHRTGTIAKTTADDTGALIGTFVFTPPPGRTGFISTIAANDASALVGAFIAPGSNVVNHGASFTVTGSGFGTKATAAPILWSRMTGTIGTDYDGVFPNSASPSTRNMQYRAVGWQGVAGPHARCTNYATGYNQGGAGPQSGTNTMVTKLKSSRANNDIYYQSWYARVHPNWNFGTGDVNNNNHKLTAWNPGGTGPYEGDDNQIWYTDLDQGGWTGPGGNMNHKISVGVLQNPDNNGHNVFWNGSLNYASQWVHFEQELKIHGSTGNTGYLKMWGDGTLLINYVGRTDNTSFGPTASWGIGGYSGNGASTTNCWRYFADHYLDWTAQRVILANNATLSSATIREPQPPTSWNNTTIQVTVNLGKFATPGASAWMCVVNSTGAQVGSGTPVVIGS